MVLGLHESLWSEEPKVLPRSRKAVDKMVRLNIPLDPGKTGRDAQSLETTLRRMIVGQDEAIEQIVNIYQMHLTGMNPPGRPIGNFLFLGPTGSGKTRIVEATAEVLLKNPRSVIKIDCAEFQHSHEIAKLIGSPPGYLGHRETQPLLTQEVLDQHHTETLKLSLVLFDEIEKASDALWQLLLGILDKATLTLGDNRRVDFSHTMVFLTSNLGSQSMMQLMTGGIGFSTGPRESDEAMDRKIYRTATDAARRKFSPEFMNRIDKVIVFRTLQRPHLEKILDIELGRVQERIISSSIGGNQFVFKCQDRARDFLLREGTDSKFGARHLKRAIERFLVFPLSNLLATRQIQLGDLITVDVDEDGTKLVFLKDDQGALVKAMDDMAAETAMVHVSSRGTGTTRALARRAPRD